MMDAYDALNYLNEKKVHYRVNELKQILITQYCPLKALKPHAITWLKQYDAKITEANPETLFICKIEDHTEHGDNVIFVESLKRTFFRIIRDLFNLDAMKESKIEPSAVVLSKQVGDAVYIGHHTFIDKEVTIGDGTIIMHNVTIQGKVVIGDDCLIESGAVIGGCGFGTYLDEEGHPELVPHPAGVTIGDHVKIFANTCIVRGCLSDTIIEDHAMVDNLCHIAHNVHLHENVQVAACSEISGSATIGRDSWIAPGVTILNGIHVGENVYTGIGSNLVKDVPDHTLVYGNPAKSKK